MSVKVVGDSLIYTDGEFSAEVPLPEGTSLLSQRGRATLREAEDLVEIGKALHGRVMREKAIIVRQSRH